MSSSAAKTNICVLGAGCIGLSSAAAIARALQGSDLADQVSITIVAEEFPPHTTSDVAAGLWEPYDTVTEREVGWSAETLRWMQQVYRTREDAGEMGVFPCTVSTLSPPSAAATAHAERVRGVSILSAEELERYGDSRLSCGFRMQSFVADPSRLLPWLVRQCRERHGIAFRRRSVRSLRELGGEFDAVVNCCGLGAVDLLGDGDLAPVRGQVVRVEAPWVKEATTVDLPGALTYVIPLVDFVVLGGTAVRGDWNRDAVAADTAAILERCGNLFPSLRRAKVLGAHAGLRPKRTGGVRLETEIVPLTAAAGHRRSVVHGNGDGRYDTSSAAGDERDGESTLPFAEARRDHAADAPDDKAAALGNGRDDTPSAACDERAGESTSPFAEASSATGRSDHAADSPDNDDIGNDAPDDKAAALGAAVPDLGGERRRADSAGRSHLFVVHNYGHGGCGVTMHRGCAREACDLVMRWLRDRHTRTIPLAGPSP